MIFDGGNNFLPVGLEFKKYFIELANLKPYHQVLDVGCGIGRMAIPLTDYITHEGEYWGFDIEKKSIQWCQKNITTKFNNFHFQHINVYNKHYNRKGTILGENFKFPYTDNSFDFIFLTSVFTHLLPDDLENYVSEISRVLKERSNCLISLYLINNESKANFNSGKNAINFNYKFKNYYTSNKNDHEAAVGYDEEFINQLLLKYKLKKSQPFHYGSWCNRNEFLSFQDIIIIETMDH